MKKIFIINLLLLLLLISCGGGSKKNEAADGTVTLRFATWDSGEALNIQKEIAKKFEEKNPNIKVQVEAYGDGFDQKLVAAFGAKDAPDVMYMWDFPTYGSSLEDLNAYIEKDSSVDMKDFYEGLMNYVQLDGKTYGIPAGFTTHVIYFNKKLFDDANVPYPTEEWTWEEFAEKAQKLSKPEEKVYGFDVLAKPDPYDFEQFLWSFGSSYISPDGKTLKGYMDSPESAAAAQLFAEYLVSEEGAEILYEKAYNVTARKNIENINGLKDDDALKVYTEAFDDAVPMPQVKRISYYWTTMQSVLSAVFDGKITPEEGAKKAQDDFEALVASE